MYISQFKQLEVVNIYNGKILGTVSDYIINLEKGRISAIIVREFNHIMNIFNQNEHVISWSEIKKIGEEVILVAFGDEPTQW